MLELRVLNGLHQGAAVPLDDNPVVVGGSLRADLNLADPGIQENHLTIEPAGQGYRLVPENGRLWDRNLVPLRGPQTVSEDSSRLCLAGIWIDIVQQEHPWTDPALLPTPPSARKDSAGTRRGSRKGTVPLTLGALAITFWTLAMAQGFNSTSGDEQTVNTEAATSLPGVDYTDPTDPTLQARLHEMLRERRIHSGVDLESREDGWVLTGQIAEDQLPVLERMIARFDRQQNPEFGITNKVTAKRYELPFDVVQVNAGPHGSILTNDGMRLFEGDSRDGFTLISIESDQLVFEGPERVAMSW